MAKLTCDLNNNDQADRNCGSVSRKDRVRKVSRDWARLQYLLKFTDMYKPTKEELKALFDECNQMYFWDTVDASKGNTDVR